MPETPSSADPRELIDLVRSPDSPRELRVFAARGLLPVERDDRMRALLAVLEDSDEEVATAAKETLAAVPPDELATFLDRGEPTQLELDCISRHSDDHFVLERVIRSRIVHDQTLLRLAGTVTGAPQESLIVNQVRLLRQPALIDALLENPSLTVDGRRRLLELREEFFEKEARRREQAERRRQEEERRARQEAEGIVFDEAGEAESEGSAADGSAEEDASVEPEDQLGSGMAAVFRRIAVMTVKEKVDLAQKGSKEERRILIGDVNMLVSLAVLKCESLAAAEVEQICSMRHLHAEIFREIASSREWIKRPKIQLALVLNPAVPINITLPLVKYLGMRDLRNIMRDRNLPEGIRTTARKILFEKRGA